MLKRGKLLTFVDDSMVRNFQALSAVFPLEKYTKEIQSDKCRLESGVKSR